MKLTSTEELVIVQHVLKLDEQGYSPRLTDVEDTTNSLPAERNQPPVGKNWAGTFVKRRPELTVKFNRRYDYKRALCEDSEVIQSWFCLVENTKAKYDILDEDTYNFDESGFMMGVISTGAVVTGSERRDRPKTVQQGDREWASIIASINAMGVGNSTLCHLPRQAPPLRLVQGAECTWQLGYQRLREWLDKQRAWIKVAKAL
jgi:hypothetical protein